MSLNIAHNPGQTESEVKFTNYQELLAPERPKLQEYVDSAEAVGDSWAYARKQHANPEKHVNLREVWSDLMNRYVVQEEDPHLRLINAVMVDAPIQAARDEKLASLYETYGRHNGRDKMKRDERELMDNLKRGSVEYNHKLRKMILDSREMGMGRVELTRLLTHSSGTEQVHSQWGRDITSGVISEVALFDGLNVTPGVENPQFTTIDRDLRGVDLEAQIGRHRVGFDAKFDKPIMDMQWGLDNDNDAIDVTLGVPVEAISDMGLSKWGEDYFKNRVGPRLEAFAASKDK